LGEKYTKCNKINNKSENFRGARLLLGGLRPPLVAGLTNIITDILTLFVASIVLNGHVKMIDLL